MKPIVYKPDAKIAISKDIIIDLTVDEDNEMSNAKQKSGEVHINLKDLKKEKKTGDVFIDLTNGDLSNIWSSEHESDFTVPPETGVASQPVKIEALKTSFKNPFNRSAGHQRTKRVYKKKTEDKSEEENMSANNPSAQVVLNPLRTRMKRHREHSPVDTAMGDVHKKKKISIEKTQASDPSNYNKASNLDDYLIRPKSIAYPITVDKKSDRFFKVRLVQITSPSQFMFQFNIEQLQLMMDQMK